MNKEIYNQYSLFLGEREMLENQMTEFCKQFLYHGKKIKFKFGNMKSEAPAEIVWANVDFRQRIEIKVKNLKTGKDRKISPEDIVYDA